MCSHTLGENHDGETSQGVAIREPKVMSVCWQEVRPTTGIELEGCGEMRHCQPLPERDTGDYFRLLSIYCF